MVTDIEIRPAMPQDVPEIVAMVGELAEYERAAAQFHLTGELLDAALFCDSPAVFGHVATGRTVPGGARVTLGFALWFLNYSTWEGVHGIYLEDLYVRAEARGAGVGLRLMATLAAICTARGYRRLEWWVLRWNPAREFYHSLGACAADEWVPYRLDGKSLHELAEKG